jgi:adenosylhomocysteine nucleosidase
MNSTEIGLVAAMPEETAPLLKLLPPIQSRRLGSYRYHRLTCAGRTLHLIQAGMGPANAAAATRTLLELAHPGLLLSIGFAGAVRPGPQVGDLIVARQLLGYEQGCLSPAAVLSAAATDHMTALLARPAPAREWRSLPGTFVTTGHSVAKGEINLLLPAELEHPVLEMETAAVAAVAETAGIPCAALRTVSDPADEELGFTLEEITDPSLRLMPAKVALLILKRPRIIPQLCRLASNVRLAGRNLAQALTLLLETTDA